MDVAIYRISRFRKRLVRTRGPMLLIIRNQKFFVTWPSIYTKEPYIVPPELRIPVDEAWARKRMAVRRLNCPYAGTLPQADMEAVYGFAGAGDGRSGRQVLLVCRRCNYKEWVQSYGLEDLRHPSYLDSLDEITGGVAFDFEKGYVYPSYGEGEMLVVAGDFHDERKGLSPSESWVAVSPGSSLARLMSKVTPDVRFVWLRDDYLIAEKLAP